MSSLWWMLDVTTLALLLPTYLGLRILGYFKPQYRPPVSFERWRAEEIEIDEIKSQTEWAATDADNAYDYQALLEFKSILEQCRRGGDLRTMCGHLRQQSSRNLCRVLTPSLYQHSRVQTKRLIHEYVREVRRCVHYLFQSNQTIAHEVSVQDKTELLRDMRQSLGRTTLVLQGGALLSMCHFGVIRALYRRKMLPRIITGTGTGSLVAAIVGTTTNDRLMEVLDGDSIDLSAFVHANAQRKSTEFRTWSLVSKTKALVRRLRRFWSTGHFFDITVLASCAQDNLGNMTFEEAYALTGRVLNLAIAVPNVAGTPQLLNYITAPHVLIWSAVSASIATSKSMYAPINLLCKDDTGVITPYFAVDATRTGRRRSSTHHGSPLERIGEHFNVNHYVISQTRPYIVLLLWLQEVTSGWPLVGVLVKLGYSETLHWLDIFDRIGLLPTFIQRIMIDEVVPSSAPWSKFVITPDFSVRDYFSVFDVPTREKLRRFATKGERSVWPMVCQLKIRTCIELELDAVFQANRQRVSISANGSG